MKRGWTSGVRTYYLGYCGVAGDSGIEDAALLEHENADGKGPEDTGDEDRPTRPALPAFSLPSHLESDRGGKITPVQRDDND